MKAYPTDGNITGQYPHHSMTCNVINGAQMLVIGGSFPLTQDCDAAPQRGTHNLVLGTDAAAEEPDSSWQLYSPDLTAYAVPSDIASAVGGGAAGGATRTAPSAGFDNPDLDVLMTKRASVATRTPTRAVPQATGRSSSSLSSDGTLSTGAEVGIAVGGAVGLCAVLVGLFCLVRRHVRRRRQDGGHAAHGRLSKSSGGGSGAYTAYGPGSPWAADASLSGGASGGPRSPNSYMSLTSPFARRPSNINVQQGPVELAAPLDSPGFEMSQVGGGGTGIVPHPPRLTTRTPEGVAFDQPKIDDQGRAWYPQVSMANGMIPSSTPHVSHDAYSPLMPESPPQELSSERHASTGGWSEGESNISRAASTQRGTFDCAQDTRRHDTFYHG